MCPAVIHHAVFLETDILLGTLKNEFGIFILSAYLLSDDLSMIQQFFVSKVLNLSKLPLTLSPKVLLLPRKQLRLQSPQPKASKPYQGQAPHMGTTAHTRLTP